MNSFEIIKKIKNNEIGAIDLERMFIRGTISKEFYEKTMKEYFYPISNDSLSIDELKNKLKTLETEENNKKRDIEIDEIIKSEEVILQNEIKTLMEDIDYLDLQLEKIFQEEGLNLKIHKNQDDAKIRSQNTLTDSYQNNLSSEYLPGSSRDAFSDFLVVIVIIIVIGITYILYQ
jgi:hypothetical protein